jgi:hypothetical protein
MARFAPTTTLPALILLLLLLATAFPCARADAAAPAAPRPEFLVVQRAIVLNPLDGDNDGDAHAAVHFAETLKSVRAAFQTRPTPRAAVFVDAGRDPTKGQRDRRMLLSSSAATTEIFNGANLTPRVVALGGDVREPLTKAQSASFRASKLARSMFAKDRATLAAANPAGKR